MCPAVGRIVAESGSECQGRLYSSARTSELDEELMVIRMHRRVFRLCTAGTILACGLLTMAITSREAAAGPTPPDSCARATFISASFDNNATVRAAELVPAGSVTPPGTAIAV